jgi:hypothetical protein
MKNLFLSYLIINRKSVGVVDEAGRLTQNKLADLQMSKTGILPAEQSQAGRRESCELAKQGADG